MEAKPDTRTKWTFLTSHARVLHLLARDPGMRLRDVAEACQLTERAVQAIVADLETGGYLKRSREGRRNRYEIASEGMLRHPAEARHTIGALLALLTEEPDPDNLDPSAEPAGTDEGGTRSVNEP
ncbi:helix-turn-helix transcriptional regulator [Streptomyces sp. NRRL WC-3742]|uniref:helix-turn-helix transcriptional regulator n=1 Tax=Streptomyces sp. NRRL WC-3742 TaxID=1463934 RepID=UPI00099B8E79|nr:helix-turn-helix domain-containing protein [Streptomyces sp. NRRL WC-3742]